MLMLTIIPLGSAQLEPVYELPVYTPGDYWYYEGNGTNMNMTLNLTMAGFTNVSYNGSDVMAYVMIHNMTFNNSGSWTYNNNTLYLDAETLCILGSEGYSERNETIFSYINGVPTGPGVISHDIDYRNVTYHDPWPFAGCLYANDTINLTSAVETVTTSFHNGTQVGNVTTTNSTRYMNVTVHGKENITTAAGTFEALNCSGDSSQTWYAPEIGMVVFQKDGWMQFELVSYNYTGFVETGSRYQLFNFRNPEGGINFAALGTVLALAVGMVAVVFIGLFLFFSSMEKKVASEAEVEKEAAAKEEPAPEGAPAENKPEDKDEPPAGE